MMKTTLTYITFLTIMLLLQANASRARNGDRPVEKGFSGYVETGILIYSTSSQLAATPENEKTDSLDKNTTEFQGGGIPAIFDLRYTLNDLSNQLYVGTPEESLGSQINLGAVHFFDDESRLDCALAIIPQHVWENPYDTQKERDETGMVHAGINLTYEGIGGTGLALYQNFYRVAVEDDTIAADYPDLERKGLQWESGIGYKIPWGGNQVVTPEFYYTRADMKGESQSFERYEGSLKLEHFTDSYGVEMNLAIKNRTFDKKHPLFNKIRKENVYTGAVIFTLPEPFGLKNAYARFGAGYEYGDTNIDFFDYHTFITGTSMGYNF